jgi:hypothetical protein
MYIMFESVWLHNRHIIADVRPGYEPAMLDVKNGLNWNIWSFRKENKMGTLICNNSKVT